MKNISLALNIALLLAVGFLYYKQFSGGNNETTAMAGASDSTAAATRVVLSELPKNVPVVFINADSLFTHYEFAKKAKAQVEGKVATYQKSYQAKVDAFQKEYQDYMEKAGAGVYTKEQGTAIEQGLQKKRDDIMAMEQNQDKVMNEMDNSNVDVQKSIYNFLTRFNKEHGYYCAMAYTTTGGGVLGVNDSLDVTQQVLAGLNSEYNAAKGK
ncbi:MAG: OmpH family outer membrane protein [Bacteroidetes bacterium]|nr:MAG: OmpH family outer membrane protein [Bacteroidota bacterium]